jgi:DNA-binding NarL/FixJ family response regulator
MVSTLLTSLGAIVVGEVANGSDAIDCAHHYHPDLVVMDGNMPGTNGYEATRTIKATMPHVRVAIVSVSSGSIYEQQAANVSADVFITKSTLKESLRDLIGSLRGSNTGLPVGAAA